MTDPESGAPVSPPTLDLTLSLPQPRWAAGSIVRLQGLLAVVDDILIRGRWVWTATKGPELEINYYCYRLVAQAGSDRGIRPGTVWDLDGNTVDAEAQASEVAGPLTTADRADTIQQRHADWLAQETGYPPTHTPPA